MLPNDYFFFIIAVLRTQHAKHSGRAMLATIISFAQVCKTALTIFKKCYRFGNIFCYTRGMDYIQVVIDAFWIIMEKSVPVVVPILAIILIFTFIRSLLFYDR